jgi:hypothetical protein
MKSNGNGRYFLLMMTLGERRSADQQRGRMMISSIDGRGNVKPQYNYLVAKVQDRHIAQCFPAIKPAT